MSDNLQDFRGTQLRNIKPPLKRKMVDDNSTQRRGRRPFQARNDISEVSSPDRKRLNITVDKEEKTTNIWIIGSSYVKRAEEPAYRRFGKNFGLNAKVKWFGKGGMRWNGVLPRFYHELSTQSPPDVLVVHAGGNDLGLKSSQELASQMERDLMQLHGEFPSMTIAYSCINERQAWRYGNPKWIDNDRKAVNRRMRKAVGCFNGQVIEHPLLRFFDKSVFLPDRVHFTRKGNEIFVSSIRNAIEKLLLKPKEGDHGSSSSAFLCKYELKFQ